MNQASTTVLNSVGVKDLVRENDERREKEETEVKTHKKE